MKSLVIFILLAVNSFNGTSQNTQRFEFDGTIAIKEGETLSYKIVYDQSDNNTITGYTITDVYGENLTKTSISGKYDPVKNEISFTEKRNVYSKIEADDSTFCFVSVQRLSIKTINDKRVISGEFKGVFPTGELCATGKIHLTETNSIKKPNQNPDQTKVLNGNDLRGSDSISIKAFNQQQKMVLMSDEILIIEFIGNDLSLEFWDGAIVDNDKISILFNDQILKEDITLTREKKSIKLPVSDNNFKLKIQALNIGGAGVNTVNFAIKDSSEVKEFSSRLNTEEFFEVEFQKK